MEGERGKKMTETIHCAGCRGTDYLDRPCRGRQVEAAAGLRDEGEAIRQADRKCIAEWEEWAAGVANAHDKLHNDDCKCVVANALYAKASEAAAGPRDDEWRCSTCATPHTEDMPHDDEYPKAAAGPRDEPPILTADSRDALAKGDNND